MTRFALMLGTDHVEFTIKYRAYWKHSDASGLFVSCCPMLNIFSQGRTPEEARAALDDAVTTFVRHCWRRGILEAVLGRKGLVPSGDADDSGEGVSIRPCSSEDDDDSWEGCVPMSLIANEQRRRVGDGTWQRQ